MIRKRGMARERHGGRRLAWWLGVLLPFLLVQPVVGGENKEATLSLWLEGEQLATAGGPAVSLGSQPLGKDVQLVVVAEKTADIRGFQVHIKYDPAGLTYKGWARSALLRSALEVGPMPMTASPEGVLVLSLAFPDARPPEASGRLELGEFRFAVLDTGRATLSMPYVEILDKNLKLDTQGVKPEMVIKPVAPTKSPPPPRRLGDALWWTEATPNPFYKHTLVVFATRDSMWVSIQVLDSSGRVVRPLVGATYKGRYTTNWQGEDFGGNKVKFGDYTLVIEAGGKRDTQVVHYVSREDFEKEKARQEKEEKQAPRGNVAPGDDRQGRE